ncbi:hypothetical protein GCM10020254_43370 [Streptomyces goshikiensis]
MGVLKRFEQRLEGLVNGTFAKVFKSEVQPVEIAGALQRECDNNATIWNRERTVVPNDFIVELSTGDYERLSPYSGQLGDELAGLVRDYAKQQRYSFMGPIKVHLEKADDLDTGLYRVRSRTLASSTSQAQPQAPQGQQQPGGYGYPRPPLPHARGPAPRRSRTQARPRRTRTHTTRRPRHDAALDRDQWHTPPDLALHARTRPKHRSRRADRRPRRIPPAL